MAWQEIPSIGLGAAWGILTPQTLEASMAGDLLDFVFAKASAKSLQRYVTFLLAPVYAHKEGIKCGILPSKCFSHSLLLFLQTSKEKSMLI